MECKLYKENSSSYIYAVNRAFYLIVPKIRVNPSIEVVIDSEIKEKLDNYSKMDNIGVVRVFVNNYFEDISDEISRYKLKSIINTDISVTKNLLSANNIKYNDNIIINTPFEEFKNWYINENTRQDTFKRIKENIANPNYSTTVDDLSESQKRINELLELKKSLNSSLNSSMPGSAMNGSSETKGKVKMLNNGHSLLEKYDDGFTNVMFLSFVTIIVSLTWIILMINMMIK